MPLQSMIGLTGQLRDISFDRPVGLGRCADILTARLVPTGATSSDERTVLVALKVLRVCLVPDTQHLRSRIARWLPVWKQLLHPFVCPFLDVSCDERLGIALVLPYYKNGNVVNYLKRHPDADTHTFISEVAQGLLYLHTHTPPIVHQDIRGSNVLVDDAGHARLVDHGLVEVLQETTLTTTDRPRYQAPELFISSEDDEGIECPTTQGDVYSFGMLGVEMVTRDLPFKHHKVTAAVVVDVACGRRPRRPTAGAADPSLVDRLWPIFEACWMQNPADRPDMRAVCGRLAAA